MTDPVDVIGPTGHLIHLRWPGHKRTLCGRPTPRWEEVETAITTDGDRAWLAANYGRCVRCRRWWETFVRAHRSAA
jgi:hypothetical protein